MEPIHIAYRVSPTKRSLATGQIADWFGLAAEEPPHVVVRQFAVDLQPGQRLLLTGASGSGKSSLLRAIGQRYHALDAIALALPSQPLIEALPGSLEERLRWLGTSGLAEARLYLRLPSELSDGQRYRFRLALALARLASTTTQATFLLADEFAAYLDRTLARVLAYNLRKMCHRAGIGLLLATTHEDLIADLQPDWWVRCHGDGIVQALSRPSADIIARPPIPSEIPSTQGRMRIPGCIFRIAGQAISFAEHLWMSEGTSRDWPYFARWHYRSHHLACVHRVVLLWHDEQPIGIVVFAAPAASLAWRNRYFGLRGKRSRLGLQALNQQLWLLARVVLHPTYRGAGIAARFVRLACETCPIPWIETLSAMGQANPFFEHAGFVRVGVIRKPLTEAKHATHSGIYGARRTRVSEESRTKSRFSEPIYYVFDNRATFAPPAEASAAQTEKDVFSAC